MNPAQLLAHFDRFAEAPDAISRLRRFILDLAVRGKLVGQDSRDEPASELLKRIQAEKAQSIYEGRARKSKAALAQSDIPFNAPADWEWVPFGEIVRIRTGKLDANAAVKGGAYPFFTCSQTPSEIDSYSFDTSAVLLAGNGDFNLKCYQGKFDAYQRTYVIEPLGWDLHFCFILMKSQISRITENQRGSAIPYLKLGDIADPVVPLPPLAEQHRIVAKVDELMALCDRLEAAQVEREIRRDRLVASSLNRLNNSADPDAFHDHTRFYFNHLPRLTTRTEHIQQFRQTILNLAFQGRIVPQHCDEEAGAVLLQRIASYNPEKGRLGGRRRINQPLLDPLDCPGVFEVPDNWAWTYLVFLCETIADVDHNMPKAVSDGVPFISAKDLKDDGTIDFTAPKMISEDDYQRLSRKVQMRRDDIVYSRIGARLGKARLVNVDTRFLISYSCCLVRPLHEFIDKHYLKIFLNSTLALSQAHKGTQSIGVPDLGLGEIKAFKIPIPPLAEQSRIVAKVDELMALCDKLDAQLTTTQTDSRRLLEAVLHEALAQAV